MDYNKLFEKLLYDGLFPRANPHRAVLLALPVIVAVLPEFFPADTADAACRHIGFFLLVLLLFCHFSLKTPASLFSQANTFQI